MSRTTRNKFTKSKSISNRCRNHGDCPYCKSNRLFFDTKWRVHCDLDEQLYDFFEEENYQSYNDRENY